MAQAITQALEAAGFSPADLLQGQIVHTDLPWQTPPLHSSATLLKVPISEYLDYPLTVNEEAFYDFYSQTLFELADNPAVAVAPGGYRRASMALRHCTAGERLLRLPVPFGFPEQLDYTTGVQFALECAHIAKTSCGYKSSCEDASNYWFENEHGVIGVVDGYPSLYSDLWDMPCTGMITGMLEQPRGELSTTCYYDLVSKVRSVLYENTDKFAEFDGLDLALQALRIMSNGRLCQELQVAIGSMSMASFERKRKAKAVEEALEVMASWTLSDRTKLSMLWEKLVPTVLNAADYQRKIHDPYRVLPSVLSAKAENKIINTLKWLLAKYTNVSN